MNITTRAPVIGIAGPSYTMPAELLAEGVGALQAEGLSVRVAANVSETHGSLAGTDTQRAQGLMELCRMPDVDMIMMTRGGYGALRMLPHIDWAAINPKQPWVGFSDTTALLTARMLKTGVGGWHAPMLRHVRVGKFKGADQEALLGILRGHAPSGYGDEVLGGVTVLQPGNAQGTLWGGNLGVVRSLCGTPWMPKPKPGDILLLEDLDTDNWQLDRDLEQLAQAGLFDNLGGLIFGNFSDIHEATSIPFGFSLKEIFMRHAARVNGPVVMDFPAGHSGLNMPLPIGSKISLDAGANVKLAWEAR